MAIYPEPAPELNIAFDSGFQTDQAIDRIFRLLPKHRGSPLQIR
jgi:hypothetical protein